MLRDQVGIETIAQRVAQQVKSHHADEQRQPRPDHLQRLGPDILPGVVDHHPPFRRRRADAETEVFRSNLFPCNEFIPYDGVALGVLAVDVLVAFRGIESLGNIRRFCSALNPQIVVYGL